MIVSGRRRLSARENLPHICFPSRGCLDGGFAPAAGDDAATPLTSEPNLGVLNAEFHMAERDNHGVVARLMDRRTQKQGREVRRALTNGECGCRACFINTSEWL